MSLRVLLGFQVQETVESMKRKWSIHKTCSFGIFISILFTTQDGKAPHANPIKVDYFSFYSWWLINHSKC